MAGADNLTTSDPGSRRGPPLRLPSLSVGLVVKFAALAAVNALAIFAIPPMIDQEAWLAVAFTVVTTLAIDYLYLSRRAAAVPLRYLLPATLFLLAFQVYPVLYTGYIAFTNYGTGNLLTFDQALERIRADSVTPRPDAARFAAVPAAGPEGEPGLVLTDDAGIVFLGTADRFDEVDPADVVRDGDRVVGTGEFAAVTIREVQDRQDEYTDLQVPVDEVSFIKLDTFSTASVREPSRRYDPATGVLTDLVTGVEYREVEGTFTSDDGQTISPGWRVPVGFDNFTRILTSSAIRGPFLRVFIWNYVFAIGSVVLTFVVGLGLAMALNKPELRGRRVYRSLLIIPYALPSFMSALIWAGLLNQEFGAVNEILNINLPWLQDPTLAKASILLVNTWLGFPYMFLISTGALQAIPSELSEAAAIDGASARQNFQKVTFPLLMVSLAPLLIASFAFNFNNFNVVFLLNGGGPPIQGAETPAGHTDILISYTFRLAFESGRGQDFALAAAIGVLIFLMVATISAASFARTRVLEELN